MAVKIIVNDEVIKRISFDFEKNIKNLLQIIPVDHLNHLEKIIVEYESPLKVFGLYYGQSQRVRSAHIVIFAKEIIDYCPKYLSVIFPFFVRFTLSNTLYHEIGHHYQIIKHGYKKEKWEVNADRYSSHMQRKAFLSKGVGKIFYSWRFFVLPVINLLRAKSKRQ